MEKISANLGKFVLIMHFASRASPSDYQNSPIETITANSIGTMKTLELARNSNARIAQAIQAIYLGIRRP